MLPRRRLALADLDDDVAELLRVVSRPSVSMRQLEGLVRARRRLADLPGGASRFWRWMALATSMAVMFSDASFCGSSQARML